MHNGMPNKYQFDNIAPELSVRMFENHWQLYEKYALRYNEILSELSNPYDPDIKKDVNSVNSKFRELQAAKSEMLNAVLLHELFFENVILPDNSAPMIPGPQTMAMIQRDFPNIKATDFWDIMIKPTAKARSGSTP